MMRWKLFLVVASESAALAVGLGAQVGTENTDLMALLTNALSAIS